jgi:hypothetical protein
MRHIHGMERIRSVVSVLSRELTLCLLIAAMLGPVVASVLGWPVYTPLDVPLLVHVAILAAFALVIRLESRPRRMRAAFSRASWFALPVLAIAFAALLNVRSNVFYTARALMEGLAVLLILEVGLRELRRRALVGSIRVCTPDVAPDRPPVTSGEWNRSMWLGRGPSIRLADSITTVVGWSVLASWILIALEHRHVVGPLLLLGGALQSFAMLVLIPDAIASHSSRGHSYLARVREVAHRKRLVFVRPGRPVHSPQRSSVYRRLACHLADLRGRLPTTR